MRHQKSGTKFRREKGQRNAFIKNLAKNVILKGKIKTTETRAKAIKPVVEKLVTLARKQTLASLRLLISRVSKEAATKMYYDIAPKYTQRAGGYMRITKISGSRKGDNSTMAILEFIDEK
ncbi:MAG: 50S ribosomal protein L17 [Candidatus Paceibacterota bacterium]